jgi:tRNA/rRNA methyltransferase
MPVRVVLVRPEHSMNVGAAARLARNTGLEGLDLVAPGDWRTIECWRTAWGAHELLEQARVHASLAQALAESCLAVGFSRRDATGSAVDVREVAAEVAAVEARGRVSLVFGPESSGLTSEELTLCGRTAFIPSHPAQPSFNLSHAVGIAAYEVLRSRDEGASARPALATHSEKEATLALMWEGLRAMGALGDARRQVYERLWRGLIQRMDLTPREVRMLSHLARRMRAVAEEASQEARPS